MLLDGVSSSEITHAILVMTVQREENLHRMHEAAGVAGRRVVVCYADCGCLFLAIRTSNSRVSSARFPRSCQPDGVAVSICACTLA